MAVDVQRTLDFGNARKIINLPDGVNPQDAATVAQLNSAVEGLAWKDSVRVSTQGNLNLASPGATIDGITMAANDRVLVRAQTTASENGIYIWNGAAVAMTRALDASTFAELEQAVTTVEEGTNAATTYRQTAVNGTIGSSDVTWATFGTSSPPASETTPGIIEIATQAETDAGTDDVRALTPLKLASSPFAAKKFAANIGDGSATSYVVTHNLNTRDVRVEVIRNSGNYDTVLAEVQRTSVNAVTIIFDTAPASNAYRVLIQA
jgi:hypothetical protein